MIESKTGIERLEHKMIIKSIINKKTSEKNEKIVKFVKEIKNIGVNILEKDKWEIKNKLVLKEEKVYVLKNETLWLEVIQLHYDIIITGHEERWNIIA